MARNRHGGRRIPDEPAPVSGPGGLSQRTDGGPGNARQPIRVGPGNPHGERQEMEDMQRAAPLPAVQPGANPLDALGPENPMAMAELAAMRNSLFEPEPGGPMPDTSLGQPAVDPAAAAVRDTDTIIRLAYGIWHHPDLARLLPNG